MAIRYYHELTQALFNAYGHRKEYGIISFFYDVEAKAFIAVPYETEHADLASKILGVKKEELKFYDSAKKLIPVNIKIDVDNHISKILIGFSGLEIGFKVKHSKKDITKAKRATIKFIKHGEFPIKKPLHIEIAKNFIE